MNSYYVSKEPKMINCISGEYIVIINYEILLRCQFENFIFLFYLREKKMRNKRMSGLMVLSSVLLIIGFVFADGCKEKSSPASPPANSTSQIQPQAPAIAVVAGQTICPVMGGPINRDIFVEYEGKKVYFCCAQCKGLFEKEPQKYLSKLPQFAK